MSSIAQVARVACLPLGLAFFLVAAQAAGGLQLRTASTLHVATR